LDVVQSMIGFRQYMGQPDLSDPPQPQARPIAVGGKILIQQGWDVHAFQLGQQQGNIVNAFIEDSQCLGHAESLTHFSKLAHI
jgi:hypothetical protein